MGCPSDYVQLLRMYQGKMDQLQQKVVAIDAGNWFKIKLEAQADHFIAYDEGKMLFDVQDNKIAKGRIGLWSSNDSQARFDNLTLTLPLPGADAGAAAAWRSSGNSCLRHHLHDRVLKRPISGRVVLAQGRRAL